MLNYRFHNLTGSTADLQAPFVAARMAARRIPFRRNFQCSLLVAFEDTPERDEE
jgi:hypothetical protein